MTAAAYARYSSDLQDESSIDDQLALNDRCAATMGVVIPKRARFSDYAESGGSVVLRKGFEAMMAAAYRKEFSTLFVEKMSRLSRDSADIQVTLRHFKFLQIEIIESATGQRLDKITATVKGLAADLNREEISEMVHRGLDGVIRSGFSAGGRAYGYRSIPRAPFEKQRGGVLEIVEAEAEVVREIFARYAAGETPRKIAADLNRRGTRAPRGERWMASSIHGMAARGSGILNNELYAGALVWNKNKMVGNPNTGKRLSRPNQQSEWVRSNAEHLRVVSPELWSTVAKLKDKKSGEPAQRARAAKRVFSGLLRCGACGSGMSTKGRDHKTGRVRFGCSRQKESGDCPDARSYYIDEVEERVLGLLRRELIEPDVIRDFVVAYEAEMKRLRQSSSSRRDALQRELKSVGARATRLNNLLMDGHGDPARINSELQVILKREDELKRDVAFEAPTNVVVLHPSALDRYLTAVELLHETLGADGEGDPAKVIREVIDTIVLHPEGLSRNRHTAPPKIEIVGRLEALTGQRFLMPVAVRGNVGSGGGT